MKPFFSFFVLFFALVCSASNESTKSNTIDKFYCGFYKYVLDAKTAKQLNESGFNLVYVRGGLRKKRRYPWQHVEEDFIKSLKNAEKYNLKLIVQAETDRGYLSESSSKKKIEDKIAPMALAFLEKYGSNNTILGYCCKEEPKQKTLDNLAFYHKIIKKRFPEIKLFVVYNRVESALTQPKPYPEMMGPVAYPFFYTEWRNLRIQPPRFSLKWFQMNCNDAWLASSYSRKSKLVVVFTGQPVYECRIPMKRFNTFTKDKRKRIKSYLRNGKMGWKISPDKTILIRPSWYRAPTNTISAMAWIAVMEGAKILLHWSLPDALMAPPDKMFKKNVYLRLTKKQFNEYAEACAVFKRFQYVIMNMRKERIHFLHSKNPFLMHRTHFLKKKQGKILVLVNSDVGSWLGNSKKMFRSQHETFSINRDVSIKEYSPEYKEKEFAFTILKKEDEFVWDLLNQKRLEAEIVKGENVFRIKLPPGKGTFLFVGTQKQKRMLLEKTRKEK